MPTLVVDGHVLTENVGILTYLGGGYTQKKLWRNICRYYKKCWYRKIVFVKVWYGMTIKMFLTAI